MKVLAVIGARLNSSRLPRKHLLDLAGEPLIARIFQRLEATPEIAERHAPGWTSGGSPPSSGAAATSVRRSSPW